MSCRLEHAIWSRDTGQQPCLDRCQLLITWMSNIKEVPLNQRLHLSTNPLFVVWPPCCATPSPVVRTRPRAIPLPMTTMRKSVHGFHFHYMVMGLRLAAFGAARAPLKTKYVTDWKKILWDLILEKNSCSENVSSLPSSDPKI